MATVSKRRWISPSGEPKSAWVVRYADQAGKRRLKTFAKKKAADAYALQAGHELKLGIHTPDSASLDLAAAGRLFLARCEQGRGRRGAALEETTLRQYRCHVNRHLVPRAGGDKLSRLNGPRCEAIAGELVAALSPALARKVFTTFKMILADAHAHGLVGHNAAQGVKIAAPRRHKRRLVIPSQDDVRALLAAAEGRWRPLVVTSVFTGLRASELRGLAWADVDLKAQILRVTQRADRWNKLGSPKSEDSARTVPLPPIVVRELRAWKLQCPKGELGLVFPNGEGNVENLGNIWNRGLGPLQIKCGMVKPAKTGPDGKPLPPRARYGLHKLRHFYAAWLIENGVGPKRLQELMGHATITMTFDTYGHLFPAPAADRAMMAAAERALVG